MDLISPEILKIFWNFFRILFNFILFLLVIVLIYYGFRYMTGGQKGAQEVHSKILPLIIGIVIIFLALTIPSIISGIFK
ncbi:hypothetical protein HRbin35_00460 [bacterium HR35]|nr:hypothetical protein HRbin35_00460 [bacterium HR35]